MTHRTPIVAWFATIQRLTTRQGGSVPHGAPPTQHPHMEPTHAHGITVLTTNEQQQSWTAKQRWSNSSNQQTKWGAWGRQSMRARQTASQRSHSAGSEQIRLPESVPHDPEKSSPLATHAHTHTHTHYINSHVHSMHLLFYRPNSTFQYFATDPHAPRCPDYVSTVSQSTIRNSSLL